MNFGWIDFSQNERNKTLEVLNNLSEKGTLDELGIGYIRDKFSNIFFPGTSTLQTRAKYFLVVPYIIKDVLDNYKRNKDVLDNNKSKMENILGIINKAEENFARKVSENEHGDKENLIGINSLKQKKWVQKQPSYIYWSGIKSYKIIDTELSLYNYIQEMVNNKTNDSFIYDKKEDKYIDDDKEFSKNYTIKPYCKNWHDKDDIDLSLNKEEAEFLKNQIIQSHETTSLMAYILMDKKRMESFKEVESFDALDALDDLIPENLRKQYNYAIKFSNFVYALYIIYNLVITDNKSSQAKIEYDENTLPQIADINLEEMYNLLGINDDSLCLFLNRAKECMQDKNIKRLKELIRKREIDLKQDRAKCKNKDKNNPEQWYGSKKLDYRFSNARMIVKDIYNGLGK